MTASGSETNGRNNRNGLIGLGGKIVGSLPAQYLMLLLVNVIFVIGMLWFLDQRDEARERLLTPILAQCIKVENR